MRPPRTAFCLCAVLLTAPRTAADDGEALHRITEKALKAAGGKHLLAVRAWSMTVKRTETVGGREETLHCGTLRAYVQAPDLFRSEFESEVRVGPDGETPAKT